MSRLAWLSAALTASVLGFATPSFAQERMDGPGRTDWHAIAALPACNDPGPLQEIASKFAQKESKFWNSDLQIAEFITVREVAFRPWAVDTIPRRFCTGQVIVSDGIKRRVHFSIIEGAGMIGDGWGVEWCVVGLDRNLAYNPACRIAAP